MTNRKTAGVLTGLVLGVILAAGAAAFAAVPPDRLNYQGVLRDAADKPLDGEYDMVFRFWSAEAGGDEILVDRHLAVDGAAVTVSGGLYSVEIGTGQVLDGSGPGTYTSLTQVFADYGDVWLEIQVGSETLSPRIPVASAGYALNAGRLGGKSAGQFVDTSAIAQTKSGRLVLDATGQGSYGVEGYGDTAGGYFKDANNTGYAKVGSGNRGIQAFGSAMGGFFQDTDNSGEARLAAGNRGIEAFGTVMGGYFADSDGSGYAQVGIGDRGIEGFGNEMGGYFANTAASGYARLGAGNHGIEAFGSDGGGYFKDSGASGYAYAGRGDFGISGYGNAVGGYFEDLNSSGYAYAGHGDRGIEGFGNEMGGYFKDADGSGYAYVGYNSYGIQAYGSQGGGYFKASGASGYAYVGRGDYGITGYGNTSGGYFKDADGSGYANVGVGDRGIEAHGDGSGGYFSNPFGNTEAELATYTHGVIARGGTTGGYFEELGGTYLSAAHGFSSTSGNGAKNFVQNHPYDPSRKVVYTSLEGPEAGTYVRGRGRLVDGRAVIALDETFALVTNPDIGLTVQLTPRGRSCVLHVASLTTETLEVGSDDPACADVAFDYLVQGLRIGFEEIPVIQPKEEGEDAPIPSMASVRELIARQPELRATTPLARFEAMAADVEGIDATSIDLSRARALVAAIHEFDPAVDALPDDRPQPPGPRHEAGADVEPAAGPGNAPETATERPKPRAPVVAAAADEAAAEATASLPPGTVSMQVIGKVEPGDLLALDPEHPGTLRVADAALDAGVVGVAGGDAREGAAGGLEVPVLATGIVTLKVDAGYGAVLPGDLLVSSPTPGHAMRAAEIVPGTVIGKALDALDAGMGKIRVLLMPR